MPRIKIARLSALVAGAVAAGSIAIPAAHASWTYWHSRLDVQYPSAGMISSEPSDSGNGITCGADFGSPGPCSVDDAIPGGEITRPTTGWYSYRLHADGGPAGYSWKWTSGCSGLSSVCSIVNDQEFQTVGGEWVDTEAPVVTSVHVPGAGNGPVELYATATDNSGSIDHYYWEVCDREGPSDGSACQDWASSTGLTSVGNLVDGHLYNVLVLAFDAAGNFASGNGGSFGYDTTAPAVTITTPRPGATVDSFDPAVHFTVDEANQLDTRCSVDGGEQENCWDGWQPGFLANGPHTVSVQARDQAGNSTTANRTFTVADPTIAVVGTPESTFGQPARLQVQTARNSFGNVEFSDAATGHLLCSKPAGVSGLVACTIPATYYQPGQYDISVRYTGDATHNFVTTTVSFTVNRKATAITAANQTAKYGKAYSLTVGLPTGATGTVDFVAGNKTLCTAVVRRAHATCAVGGQQVTPGAQGVIARYSGDRYFADASRNFTLTVTPGATALTAAPSAPETHEGAAVTLTATGFAANATGTVAFTSKSGTLTLCVATVKKGVASCATAATLAAGHYGVLASYSGDSRWAAAKARTEFDVTTTWP